MANDISKTYENIARKIREIPSVNLCPSYRWEELVKKLCNSDDARLHDIGVQELENIRQKCPNCPVFKL